MKKVENSDIKYIYSKIDYVIAPWAVTYKTPVCLVDEWNKIGEMVAKNIGKRNFNRYITDNI